MGISQISVEAKVLAGACRARGSASQGVTQTLLLLDVHLDDPPERDRPDIMSKKE